MIILLLTGPGMFGFGQLSSNLPIVMITTPGGADIPNESKITADMKIIYNGTGLLNHLIDNGNIYSGKVGIEITDSWHSNYSPLNKPAGSVYFVYSDPKPDELASTQKEYLREGVRIQHIIDLHPSP